MRVVPRRTVVGDTDRRFDNLSGSHHQSHDVNVTNKSPSRDYSHPDAQTTQTTETPGFKPFTNVTLARSVFPQPGGPASRMPGG